MLTQRDGLPRLPRHRLHRAYNTFQMFGWHGDTAGVAMIGPEKNVGWSPGEKIDTRRRMVCWVVLRKDGVEIVYSSFPQGTTRHRGKLRAVAFAGHYGTGYKPVPPIPCDVIKKTREPGRPRGVDGDREYLFAYLI